MNLYYFFSSRLNSLNKSSFSYLVSRIAILSVATGVGVMTISFAILEGFQQQIERKIFSFGGHLQISKYDNNNSFEELPIPVNTKLYKDQKSISGIDKIHSYSIKAGLLKTNEGVHGVVLKGVTTDFYLEKFSKNIIEGRFIHFEDSTYSKDLMISKIIAEKMRIGIGDTLLIYFIQNPPRFRKLKVCGIYESGLEEFDELIVVGDLKLNQRLNNWGDSLVGGYEVFIKDFSKIDQVADEVYNVMDFDLQLEKITDKYLQIFEWLALLDRNVVIFLILILAVASFNMVSTLFIMIMERTNMIGILKALGATNRQIQSIFIYNGFFIIVKGLFWGNLVGLGFCFLQYQFKMIPLDQENYYMSSVPIEWNWWVFTLINICAFLLISLVLMISALVISRIKPSESIKFN